MSLTMVEQGHLAHAIAMFNETYHLAWGNLGVGYPWPWTLGGTPPISTSIAIEETLTRGAGVLDPLSHTGVLAQPNGVLSVETTGGSPYIENTDWTLAGDSISWAGGASVPGLGVDYDVVYRYSEPDITELISEVGRRKASQVGYAVEDPNGSIQANGSNYSVVTATQAEITDITCLSNIQAKAAGTIDNKILIVASEGYAGNITVVIEEDSLASAGSETSSYNASTKTLTIGIEDSASTQAHISTAITLSALIESATEVASGATWVIADNTNTVTLIGGTGFSGGEYFTISSTTENYYVWLNKDSTSIDPGDSSMVLMTGLECQITDGDSAALVAEAVKDVIDLQAAFGATRYESKVTVTNTVTGIATDAVDNDTGFTILATQQGSLYPTKNIYLAFRFDAVDAVDEEIYQIGIFLNTVTDPSLPAGQLYFTPVQVTDQGTLYMIENLEPFPRSSGKREIFEYIITY